jgi:hypothetical protein
MENTKIQMAFAAIDKTIVSNIPVLKQEEYRNKEFVYYGTDNQYPEYLFGLYTDVSTLKTVIDGTANYVAGDDARCNVQGFDTVMNKKGDTLRNIVKWCSRDYNLYGGFALEVIRNLAGQVAEVYYIDFRYLRSDKKNESFWYSEDYGKKYMRTSKAILYPKYVPGGDVPASIVYVKNDVTYTYPIPRYSGAIKSCEIERHIDDLHLSSLENGFMPSYIINFLNGIPEDSQKAEIEKNVTEKFCGSSNAGRVLLNFANGEENAAKIEKLEVSDFADKYKAAAERSRSTIYESMQAIPQLFGNMAASTGFNEVEFKTAWELFSGTVVRDQQRVIGDAFDHVFGMKNSITINPFVLGDQTDVN